VKVVHRLYLMMAPAVVAMLLLAALAYWGQYARAAPETLTVVGAVVVLVSLGSSWANARYVATRLERLAAGGVSRRSTPAQMPAATTPAAPRAAAPGDEIDEIERVVDQLSGAVESAETDSAHQAEVFAQRAEEYARLLVTVADTAARELEEVRLPLHILLENRFGDLNENQEEMLGAARAAAEVLDADVMSIRQIAELDLDEHPMRRDRIKPFELIEAIRPMLMASADAAGVAIELEIAPLLPAIVGDSARLQDAMVTVIRAVLAAAEPEARVRLVVEQETRSVKVAISGGGAPRRSIRWAAAMRVIRAHDGVVDERGNTLTLSFPTKTAG
jgi:signal transduction histidine kinase